jgi:DNA-binding LacI/PurR family transcriptional regulator
MSSPNRAEPEAIAPFAPGSKRRPTSYDVARLAGVAQSTVSRCFRADSNISQATRELVRDAARRLGYMPNALARSLITRRSNMVGVIATKYTLRGNPDVIYAIGEALAAAGKQLLLVTAEADAPTAADLHGALEYPLDGLISCVLMADRDIKSIQQRGIPMVFYNRHSPNIPMDGVTTDHFGAARQVAGALHAAGHRRFLCISGPAAAPVSRERQAGFLDGLAALDIRDVPLIETDYSYAGGHDGFLRAGAAARPEAVFCANDQIAMGVMDACRFTLGLRVPEDISVVGFDDVAEAGRPSYWLTTMHQDSVEMARRAVQLLLQRLNQPDQPVMNALIEARFMLRGSARIIF